MSTFFLPPVEAPPRWGPELRSALQILQLPTSRPRHALNQIGARLERLLQPQARGGLPRGLLRRFLEGAAQHLASRRKPWSQLSDQDLLRELGARPILIAAGRSSRFSPCLARKQLARADQFSPLVLQARQAVGFHGAAAVIVVDPLTAGALLFPPGCGETLTPAEWRRALRRLPAPARRLRTRVAQGPRELPHLLRAARALLHETERRSPAHAEARFQAWACRLLQPFVHQDRFAARLEPLLGRQALLAVAPPWGPGAALLEGLRTLRALGRARETRYVVPIYADYAPALLPEFPPVYLLAYLETVAAPGTVLTLGAKSPRDTVRDRGQVLLVPGPAGPLPQAIREWRDLSPAAQAEAEQRLAASRRSRTPQHALNAGVFVFDRAWAARQAARLRRDFDHPDSAKDKLHEYWYTDLVELAARQGKPRRLVFLGAEAPSGCKEVPRTLAFGARMIRAVRQCLVSLGVHLAAGARVRLRSREPSTTVPEMARRIFGPQPDAVHLFGEIFLEDTVRLGPGVVLDGRRGPVELRGNTRVGAGVGLRDSTAADTCFADHPLDALAYQPPAGTALQTPTQILSSTLERCWIAPGTHLDRARLRDAFVEGRVLDAAVEGDLVAPDEILSRRDRPRTARDPGPADADPDLPGAFRIGELSPRQARGVRDFLRRETEQFLRTKIQHSPLLEEALAATRQLWLREDLLHRLTPEQVYRHAFGWLRRAGVGDPFAAEKQAELEALKPLAWLPFEARRRFDWKNDPERRRLFRELSRQALAANFLDWQSPTVRALRRAPGRLPFPELLDAPLAIDGSDAYESLVFEGGPACFLYLTDNLGEALFDAVVWWALGQLGHRVVVAAKEKPAGGEATVQDLRALCEQVPTLRTLYRRRALQIVSNGNDTYGTFLSELPEAFRAVWNRPDLRAVIGKGQANLYTTVARNPLHVPYVAQFLIKGMTAERLTGVRLPRRGGRKIPRPALAVIPPGLRITSVAPGTPGAGTLRQLLSRAARGSP